MKFLRASLAAMCCLVFALVAAPAAQAHQVARSSASCQLVNNVPTVTFNVVFEGFSSSNKPVSGTITLDGVSESVAPFTWDGGEHTFVWSQATSPGAHTVKGVFSWPGQGQSTNTTTATVTCPNPETHSIGIQVDKLAVEQTAVAGSVVHFTISVTNTGNTSFVGYVFDDPNCDEQRTGANAADPTLDPGETWTYACAMATQVGQTSADNTATATGTNSHGDSATDSGSASIPLTQPQGVTQTPPQGGTPPPAGGVLPETVLSGRARLSGPSGCVKRAFRARVTGRSITSVAFYVDGKLVKRFTANRSSYSIKVKPSGLGFGRHRIIARVKFVRASGTEARNLPLTFRRCARAQVTPQFTG
jgi:hypothetical protein